MNVFQKKVNLFTLYLTMGANILTVLVFGVLETLVLNLSKWQFILAVLLNLALVNGAIAWGAGSAPAANPDAESGS